MHERRIMLVGTITLACAAATIATVPAGARITSADHQAGTPGVRVLASGLNGPFEVSALRGPRLLVTESDVGQLTRVNRRTGHHKVVVDGLDPGMTAGAVKIGATYVAITGEAGGPPDGGAAPPPPKYPGSSVLTIKNGKVRQLADLGKYELRHNPDGQRQFNKQGEPLDALSNPFYMLRDKRKGGYVLVADGGGNDVLAVNRKGKVSTFFVPPVVRGGACKGQRNNDKRHTGCDPVPTGLAYGTGNRLYVSTLGAEAPGAGRVYVLNARTGKVRHVIKHLTAPTGVAVDHARNVYLSQVLHNAPAGNGPPPPGFDPSSVGRILKVAHHGGRSYAGVTMPTGLLWRGERLYSSSWSIASFIGLADAGQVVRVADRAFA